MKATILILGLLMATPADEQANKCREAERLSYCHTDGQLRKAVGGDAKNTSHYRLPADVEQVVQGWKKNPPEEGHTNPVILKPAAAPEKTGDLAMVVLSDDGRGLTIDWVRRGDVVRPAMANWQPRRDASVCIFYQEEKGWIGHTVIRSASGVTPEDGTKLTDNYALDEIDLLVQLGDKLKAGDAQSVIFDTFKVQAAERGAAKTESQQRIVSAAGSAGRVLNALRDKSGTVVYCNIPVNESFAGLRDDVVGLRHVHLSGEEDYVVVAIVRRQRTLSYVTGSYMEAVIVDCGRSVDAKGPGPAKEAKLAKR